MKCMADSERWGKPNRGLPSRPPPPSRWRPTRACGSSVQWLLNPGVEPRVLSLEDCMRNSACLTCGVAAQAINMGWTTRRDAVLLLMCTVNHVKQRSYFSSAWARSDTS